MQKKINCAFIAERTFELVVITGGNNLTNLTQGHYIYVFKGHAQT